MFILLLMLIFTLNWGVNVSGGFGESGEGGRMLRGVRRGERERVPNNSTC